MNFEKMKKELILAKLNELPTLPIIYQKLVDTMANRHSTTNDIVKIISSDQVSASKVLRIANSPIFGLTGKITNISQAVMHLGFFEIRNILLAVSVMNLIKMGKVLQKFKPQDFWKHTIAVGVIARFIGKHLNIKNLEDLFLAGILHDIGKLFLFTEFYKECRIVLDNVAEKGTKICDEEEAIFGYDHTEIGSWILEKWNQPQEIIKTAKYHEIGYVDGKLDLTLAIIYVSNIYARKFKFGNPCDNYLLETDHRICEFLQLDETFFENSKDEMTKIYEEMISIIFN